MESVEDRIARLEQQVAALQRYLGVDLSRGEERRFPPELYEALRHGKTIKAIAIYRKETGASLRDAKNAVEAMQRRAGSGF
ncbi:ribosomal protein L7/L12 [Nonomuraea thailandensis]|uniref:Ribosomal protein L7/L12 n=1 Tax=Nonomuraea thailandensis TaxID=1188745 RepID=A0A9X2GQY4_9ACTN|nr:hypothetical protein [Nonomuraea thailandensis]MCP2362162.1 ribosomal protein L7/L12 [Nonomuraea thailandensis]